MNEFVDKVLLQFRRYNVDYLDFREVFLDEGMTLENIFYKTDHQWNIPSAFFATNVILDYLRNKFGDDIDQDGYYMNPDNYTISTYKEAFLGDQGRESGIGYIETLDDYTYIYPKYDTEYTYRSLSRSGESEEEHGAIDETLVDIKNMETEDVYERELDKSYIHGIHLSDQIINEKIE